MHLQHHVISSFSGSVAVRGKILMYLAVLSKGTTTHRCSLSSHSQIGLVCHDSGTESGSSGRHADMHARCASAEQSGLVECYLEP